MFDGYYEVMENTGAELFELVEKQRWDQMQKWREAFARPYHNKTGKWKDGQFEWHVFSFEHTKSIHGERAIQQYKSQSADRFLVIPENEMIVAYSCVGGYLPDFRILSEDIYVWPEGLSWTMAYTHEADSGLGPYYCKREWIV